MMPQDDESDALVIAAHADDESLGCAGTIARKIAAGARVELVFLTDGAASPWKAVADGTPLVETRRQEAIAACGLLGVPADALHFLAFPDGRLGNHQDEAATALAPIIAASTAFQIFVPYRHDDANDHDAAYAVLAGALKQVERRRFEIFEYPIWAWRHWPWVFAKPRFKALWRTVVFGFGLRFLLMFSTVSSISGTLPVKGAALAAHRSQMGGESGGLSAIDGGAFRKQFLREYEVFRRSTWR